METGEGGRVTALALRPFGAEDAETVAAWVKDERTYYRWCAGMIGRWPVTAEALRDELAKRPDNRALVLTEGGRPAGFLCLYYKDEARTVARFCYVLLDAEKRGRGLGKRMMALAARYAFEEMDARRLNLAVFENNPAALRCYEAVGFREPPGAERRPVQACGEEWRCVDMWMERPPA